METVFLILHYNDYESTVNCVKSIEAFKCKTVIVCNGSKNGTDEHIEKEYSLLNNFAVIINRKNLGYANGLNVGIKYIKKNIDYDFIVCLNNDVIIYQSNFIKILEKEYKKDNFDVCGPKVLDNKNKNSNPTYVEIPSINNVSKELKRCKRMLSSFSFYWRCYYYVIRKINHTNYKKKTTKRCMLQLNGSCIILSKSYIDKMGYLFSRTFLYGEEKILSYICYKEGMSIKYIDKLEIIHVGSVSSKKEINSEKIYKMFYYNNLYNSLLELLSLINYYEK